MTPDDVDLLFAGLARLDAAARTLTDGSSDGADRRPGSRFFAPTRTPDARSTSTAGALAIHAPTRFEWLADTFDLSPFDVDVILIALAPEVDRAFGRRYDH